ncbi:asparagine synthase-related protein [Dyella sp. 2HG41-7]|uniref:asparagine synthase-related protein n=1 Tax=Dyella sp. 2HG41-7 TaxID=2883239 RepID=UPI001F38EEC8|nr:asparagine synthase-related protein [Dyella sp. 2HG41-7]
MNTSIFEQSECEPIVMSETHLHTSPYAGAVDFSPLDRHIANGASIDPISLADLLRNAFVYPPHTIYRDVKNIATGFALPQGLNDEPRFHFAHLSTSSASRPASNAVSDEALLNTYHELLVRAVHRCTADIKSPWLLQSGGKDSTSLAIAIADARPDTTCVTYLGGKEENEVESARFVANRLGLRHEGLVCDPGRAYDRYLAMVPRIPLLTADFATLSCADLAAEIGEHHGDGIMDALGVDPYFGSPLGLKQHLIGFMARDARIPGALLKKPFINRSFKLCYALGTLQMNPFERHFPGSRFSDGEVDELFGWNVSKCSRKRMEAFHDDMEAAESAEALHRMVLVVLEAAGFAKGMYTAKAMGLKLAYPYCDVPFCEWVFNSLPNDRLIGPGGVNKVLMRRYIAQRFDKLPYVQNKGSFRFDVLGLAKQRYEQVHAFALLAQGLLPGASKWLEEHRHCLDNKFFASKFYLLAVTLPWLLSRLRGHEGVSSLTT